MKNILGLVILLTGAIIGTAFNVEVTLPDTYHSVMAGENLWFTSKLINLGNHERMDVTLIYDILDKDDVVVATHAETVAVDTQASFVGNIRVPKNIDAGTYFLRVSVITPEKNISTKTSFDVIKKETKNQMIIKFSLFDIIVSIPDKYKSVTPGSELLTSIKLINVGSQGRVDVFLNYIIYDGDNQVILKKQETVAVETQANFIRTFDIPKNAKPGHSRIQAKITYADGKYAASDHSFEIVSDKPFVSLSFAMRIGGVVLVVLIGIILFKYRPDMDSLKVKSKVSSIVKKRMKRLNDNKE